MMPMLTQQQQNQPTSLAQAPIPQADIERKRELREAWKAYRGKFPRPLKVNKDQTDPNVISNRCAPIVDKGVSFLFGQVVKIEATDEVGKAARPAQDFLDGLWGDDDDKMTLLAKIATNGGVCGQYFVKLIAPVGPMLFPRLVNLDPMLIRMVTDPEDCDVILAYVIEYPGGSDLQKRQIITRVDPERSVELWGNNDPQDTWTITNYQRRGTSGPQNTWQQVGDVLDWSYPFAPIVTNQNLPNPNEAWGFTDLPPELIDQNKALNFTQSNTQQIIKWHGHPKTIATGVRAAQIEVAVDDVLCLPSPDSKMMNLEMQSNLQSSRDFAGDIRTSMNEQSRVPGIALGTDEPKGSVSGVALKVYYQPLLEKTTQKQRLYGRLIREISRAALVLAGIIPVAQFETYKIALHWQSLLPVDDIAAANEALILQQLDVSNATILSGLGLDPDDEATQKAQEDAKKLTAFSRGVGMPPAAPVPPGQTQEVPAVPPDGQPQAGMAQ